MGSSPSYSLLDAYVRSNGHIELSANVTATLDNDRHKGVGEGARVTSAVFEAALQSVRDRVNTNVLHLDDMRTTVDGAQSHLMVATPDGDDFLVEGNGPSELQAAMRASEQAVERLLRKANGAATAGRGVVQPQ